MSTERSLEPASAGPRGPLVVRLCNWVGEVVLAVPALRRLEAAGYELHLVGKRWAPALLAGTGWPVLVRPAGLRAAISQLRQLRRSVAPNGSRIPAVLLTKSLSSAVEARFAGLAATGYARDGRSPLLASAVPLPRFEHAAHAYWQLVSHFLGTEAAYPTTVTLPPGPLQVAAATALLARHGLTAGNYALFCPFSGADDRERRKVWPGFGELAARCTGAGLAVVVCPGPGEEALARAELPSAIQLPDVDLSVYGALLYLARVVVANDTGPGHLAAAVGARLVSVYGPQSVAAWAPLGDNVRLMHPPGGWSTIEEVSAAALA